MRKNPLVNEQYYHVITRSIAKYEVFSDTDDFERIIGLLKYCQYSSLPCKYSKFLLLSPSHQKAIIIDLEKTGEKMVSIIAYCIMPTHIHLILKQLSDGGISKFMNTVLDSYTRYFNIKHNRKGPLWEGRFKSILVENDEQILHLTRYVHLNAVSAGIVSKPQEWEYSSYSEYLGKNGFCQFKDIMDIKPGEYRKFVCDRIAYQRELSKIKYILLDNYSG